MKQTAILLSIILICISLDSCRNSSEPDNAAAGQRTLKIPTDYATIKRAVHDANEGDILVIEPGKYSESNIEITKPITICSEWKLDGDISKVERTVIDSDDKILFTVKADGTEISGLTVINGNHTLNIEARASIIGNRFANNLDALSFEGSGGGYVAYNKIENDRDDGIDLDIRLGEENRGSDIVIENNTIVNSNDDGIEIRLYTYENQNIKYIIRKNRITGSKNAGIQIISYDIYTGKIFEIHHNIVTGCKTGLGCMEGAQTREDLSGASKMDETVWFYNNTLISNQMGATGGNRIMAFNNLVSGNSAGGFKRFGSMSAVVNNLFFSNGGNDFTDLSGTVIRENNISGKDPLTDPVTFIPLEASPCIDAGVISLNPDNGTGIIIDRQFIEGNGPDIGALEFGSSGSITMISGEPVADAGGDIVIKEPVNKFLLRGRIFGAYNPSGTLWRLESGNGNVKIIDPSKMETEVILEKNGIFLFSFTCTGCENQASDNITVRYVKDGDGRGVFLNQGSEAYFEAEDYSYVYGAVTKAADPKSGSGGYIEVPEGTQGSQAFAEYTIGTGNDTECTIWLLVRNNSTGKSLLKIMLNRNEPVSSEIPGGAVWSWIRAVSKQKMTAGQWPLMIYPEKGSVLIDQIFITGDDSKIPELRSDK